MKKCLFFAIALMLLVSCSTSNTDSNLVFESDIEMTDLGYSIFSDRMTASSLSDAVAKADIVVLGYYEEEVPEKYVLGRYESGGLDAIQYNEGLIYNFTVDTVLKGEVKDDIIPVIKSYGYRKNEKSDEILLDSKFYKPKVKTLTILFLSVNQETKEYFVGPDPYEYVQISQKGNEFEIMSSNPDVIKTFSDATLQLDSTEKLTLESLREARNIKD